MAAREEPSVRAQGVVVTNALALRPGGSGVQTYIRQLLRGLTEVLGPQQVIAAVQSDARNELPPGVVSVIRPRADGWRRTVHGLRALPGSGVIHGLDVDLPLRPRIPTVATIHDLSVVDRPEFGPRHRVLGERLLVRRAFRVADQLIAVSNFTAERVRAASGREAVVTPLAASPEMARPSAQEIAEFRRRYSLPSTFVAYAGDLGPRKGVELLADACRSAGVPLVLAGNRLSGYVPSGCLHLGYLPRRALPAFFGTATVVGFLSEYEGFGLPIVEAAACGAAVLTTPVPCAVEHLAGAVAVVPTRDIEAIAKTLRNLVDDHDQRAHLSRAAELAAARLSWDATVARTLMVYRDLGL